MVSINNARLPSVCVLLATYNGNNWIVDQIDSILRQKDCLVYLKISDDHSNQSTINILEAYKYLPNVEILPSCKSRFGNANRNFMRLIMDSDTGSDYYAFSDQDDIWFFTKLSRAISYINKFTLDAYSSNVLAFWPDGKEVILNKAGIQRKWDHVFESAGPGCTFVIPRRKFILLREWVISNYTNVITAPVHDWLIYFYARESGWKWFIDDFCGLRYRQHSSNEIGANHGFIAYTSRIKQILNGNYINNILDISKIIGSNCEPIRRLSRFNFLDYLWIIRNTKEMRRVYAESIALKVFVTIFFLRVFILRVRGVY